MMTFLRLLNIARTIRLERDLAALTERHEAMRADVVTYADIVGRGLDPRGDVGLLRRAMLAENDRDKGRMLMARVLRSLECGRNDDAAEYLRAVLGEAHAAPEPIHLVDRVA
jgi:hypothetical protein